MIRSLLFFTIALSLASAVLAFLTKEKAMQLTEKLSSTAQLLGVSKAENSKLKDEKQAANSKVDELGGLNQQQKDELEKLRTASASQAAEVAKLKTEVQTEAAKATDLEKKLAEKPVPPPVPLVDPATEQLVASLKADLEKTRQAATEDQQKAAQQIKEVEAKMSQMMPKPAVASTKNGAGKQPPSGEVVAYNEGWNFVVVNLGDKQGVTPESKLMIQRGGKMLARLEITDVQPKFVTAGIVYAPGISSKEKVRPGDTVVFIPKVDIEAEADRGGFNVSNLFPKPSPGQ
jgi:vacuolar-type H+-ATPase subunit I/STV1